jgi:hypothetical protein
LKIQKKQIRERPTVRHFDIPPPLGKLKIADLTSLNCHKKSGQINAGHTENCNSNVLDSRLKIQKSHTTAYTHLLENVYLTFLHHPSHPMPGSSSHPNVLNPRLNAVVFI